MSTMRNAAQMPLQLKATSPSTVKMGGQHEGAQQVRRDHNIGSIGGIESYAAEKKNQRMEGGARSTE